MFKSKRRKELEEKETELYRLRQNIQDMKHWCAADSGEIAFAMMHLDKPKQSLSCFRDELRKGLYTFEAYRKVI